MTSRAPSSFRYTGLNKACKELAEKKGDAEGVKNCLKSIKTDGLSPYLQLEVRDAKIILERHEKKSKEKPRAVSLAMDSKMVAEIRRYQNPPPVLHKVIQAALLLVGEDEDTTDVSLPHSNLDPVIARMGV